MCNGCRLDKGLIWGCLVGYNGEKLECIYLPDVIFEGLSLCCVHWNLCLGRIDFSRRGVDVRRLMYSVITVITVMLLLGVSGAAPQTSLASWRASAEAETSIHTGGFNVADIAMGGLRIADDVWAPGDARGQWHGVNVYADVDAYLSPGLIDLQYSGDDADFGWQYWSVISGISEPEIENVCSQRDVGGGDPRSALSEHSEWRLMASGPTLGQTEGSADQQVLVTETLERRQHGCLVLIANDGLTQNQSADFQWSVGASSSPGGAGWLSWSEPVVRNYTTPLVTWDGMRWAEHTMIDEMAEIIATLDAYVAEHGPSRFNHEGLMDVTARTGKFVVTPDAYGISNMGGSYGGDTLVLCTSGEGEYALFSTSANQRHFVVDSSGVREVPEYNDQVSGWTSQACASAGIDIAYPGSRAIFFQQPENDNPDYGGWKDYVQTQSR